MRHYLSRRDFLRLSLAGLGSGLLAACKEPEPSPTLVDTVEPAGSTVLTPPNTSAPPMNDVSIYKNSFEQISDLAAAGITSTKNGVKLNTENVAFQSGSQSLEAYGTIDRPAYSVLTFELSVKKLTGEETIDLSNKTVGFSYFIPAGSPITGINLVARAGVKNVVLGTGYDPEQGKWHSVQCDLNTTFANNAWIWTDLSTDDAREVIQHCQEIVFTGIRTSEGEAVETYFLFDDLNWIRLDDLNHIPLDDSLDCIRRCANARNMIIGAVLIKDKFIDWLGDPWYPYTLVQHFNMTTVGDGKAPETMPEDLNAYRFDYTYEDQKAAFAEGNGLQLRAGTGAWHWGNPLWILDAPYDVLKIWIEHKVEEDVKHWRGRAISWGVFNEVINDEGDGFRNKRNKNLAGDRVDIFCPYGYLYSPWVDGNDTSLIEAAYFKAHELDPDTPLILNEFENEEIGLKKSEFFYNFVIGMKNRGVPIGGVGFELHLMYPSKPWMSNPENLAAYLDRVDRNIKRYAAAGLLVEFTEVEVFIPLDDVDLATQAGRDEYTRRSQKQVEIYAGLMKLAVGNPNVHSFTFWSLADIPGRSGYDGTYETYSVPYTDSFLFDKNYEPKPPYFAVMDQLR